MMRAFYKGSRSPWMENILLRDAVEKYPSGWIFFQHKTTQMCRQKTTETTRHHFILFIEIIGLQVLCPQRMPGPSLNTLKALKICHWSKHLKYMSKQTPHTWQTSSTEENCDLHGAHELSIERMNTCSVVTHEWPVSKWKWNVMLCMCGELKCFAFSIVICCPRIIGNNSKQLQHCCLKRTRGKSKGWKLEV